MDEGPTFNSIDEMPRYKAPNPNNYDEETLLRKEKEVTAAAKDFPTVPPHLIEIAWDTVQTMPRDELNDVVKNKKWENQPPKKRDKAGVLKSIIIE